MWPGFDDSIGNDVPSIASMETLIQSILTIRLKKTGGEVGGCCLIEALYVWFFATVIEQCMLENGLADMLLRGTLY